jgi:hypothetical protein
VVAAAEVGAEVGALVGPALDELPPAAELPVVLPPQAPRARTSAAARTEKAYLCRKVTPHYSHTSRPADYGGALAAGDWPMARRQLKNLKALAEGHPLKT